MLDFKSLKLVSYISGCGLKRVSSDFDLSSRMETFLELACFLGEAVSSVVADNISNVSRGVDFTELPEDDVFENSSSLFSTSFSTTWVGEITSCVDI